MQTLGIFASRWFTLLLLAAACSTPTPAATDAASGTMDADTGSSVLADAPGSEIDTLAGDAAQADTGVADGDATTAAPAACPAGSCGNGVCEAGESPASCQDCAAAEIACLEQPCAAEWSACVAKPGCASLAGCLQHCGGTSACAGACAQAFGTVGVAPVWQPLAACSTKLGCGKGCGNGTCEPLETTGNCPADCKLALAGNGVCEAGEGPPPPCNRDCGMVDVIGCKKLKCANEWAVCAPDAACAQAVNCVDECGFDAACFATCTGISNVALKGFLDCAGKAKCKADFEAPCGDGVCQGDHAVCPIDCQPFAANCGDGVCAPNESAKECPADCKPAAPYAACAAALCPGPLAACAGQPGCAKVAQCVGECAVDAPWKKCATNCLQGATLKTYWYLGPLVQCAGDHGCEPAPPAGCGDGTCAAGETEATCQQDCFAPGNCGDGWCATTKEDKVTCPQDCATCLDVGCGAKPNGVCCLVSGKPECTQPTACDL